MESPMKRGISLLAVLVLTSLTLGCCDLRVISELEDLRTQNEIEELNKGIIKQYWDGKWNQRSPAILDEILSPGVFYRSPSMQMNGLDEYKHVYGIFTSAFHDSELTIDDIIADGDKVMTRVTLRCTHDGELDGIPPTGRSLTVSAFTVFRIQDGKIFEENELLDEMGMMHQLGMEIRPAASLE
jgi:steroid delta-isomerase-like uncharacterized protein